MYIFFPVQISKLNRIKGDTTLKIWVEANEWDGEKYVDDSSTRQVIEIIVDNKIELPFFVLPEGEPPVVDFAIVEDSNETFAVEANTLDFDKNLTTRISDVSFTIISCFHFKLYLVVYLKKPK